MEEPLIKEFKEAVFTVDANKLQNLIDRGMSPDTKVDGDPALQWLMTLESGEVADYLDYKKYPDEFIDKVPTGLEYRAKSLASVKVLLRNGASLFEQDEKDGHAKNFMLEKFFFSSNVEGLNEVALATIDKTIERGLPPYEFLSESFYESLAEKFKAENDKKNFVEKVDAYLNEMNDIHDAVAIRLMEPTNRQDRKISQAYSKSGNTYWVDYFPDIIAEDVMENMLKLRFGNMSDKEIYESIHGERKPAIGEDISLSKMVPYEKPAPLGPDGKPRAQDKEHEEDTRIRLYRMTQEKPEEVMADLDRLVGLKKEKKEFLKWAVQVMKKDDSDPEVKIGYSEALLGNPGTGKTSLFRLKARLLHSLGLTKGSIYGEVTSADLMARYVGQTRPKTRYALETADVLFIDEAYGLYEEGKYNYGKEAVDEIVAYTENNREKPVFFAGYDGDMQKLFTMNAGLQSRIRSINTVADYSIEELGVMFDIQVQQRGYKGVEPEAREELLENLQGFKKAVGAKVFANAREVRNVMDDLHGNVKARVYGLNDNSEELDLVAQFKKAAAKLVVKKSDMTITVEDIQSLRMVEKQVAIVGEDNSIGFKDTAPKKPREVKPI